MQVTVCASPRAPHQMAHQDAMAQGVRAIGIEPVMQHMGGPVKTKHVACWGWRQGSRLRAAGHDVLVMERGYLGNRFEYTSLGWNGLNGRATFPEYPCDGGQRFRDCGFELKPPREGGDYVLIIGQVATDMAVRDVNIRAWEKSAAEEAQRITGMPVIYRPHPEDVRRGRARSLCGVKTGTGSLNDALENAALVVTYSSNTAVDALIAGVPAVAMSPGSMAYGVAAKEIGDPVNWGAREQWAHALAWKQWTLDEIASGKALQWVMSNV